MAAVVGEENRLRPDAPVVSLPVHVVRALEPAAPLVRGPVGAPGRILGLPQIREEVRVEGLELIDQVMELPLQGGVVPPGPPAPVPQVDEAPVVPLADAVARAIVSEAVRAELALALDVREDAADRRRVQTQLLPQEAAAGELIRRPVVPAAYDVIIERDLEAGRRLGLRRGLGFGLGLRFGLRFGLGLWFGLGQRLRLRRGGGLLRQRLLLREAGHRQRKAQKRRQQQRRKFSRALIHVRCSPDALLRNYYTAKRPRCQTGDGPA